MRKSTIILIALLRIWQYEKVDISVDTTAVNNVVSAFLCGSNPSPLQKRLKSIYGFTLQIFASKMPINRLGRRPEWGTSIL